MTLAAITVAEATPIGLYHLGSGDTVVIEFQFAPQVVQRPALAFGVASIGVSASCSFSLYDAGGLIASATLASYCNGANWSATAIPLPSFNAGINVDLSGLEAGEIGRLEFTPIGPGNPTIDYDIPNMVLFGNGNVFATILSTSIVAAVAAPEPASLALLLGGLAGLRFMRRRRAG